MAGRNTPLRRVRDLDALTPDPQNANRGTRRGREVLGQSLRELGAGRSIVIDQHSVVIARNKTAEEAKALGIPIKVVRTDGRHLVAVHRTAHDVFDGLVKRLCPRALVPTQSRSRSVGLAVVSPGRCRQS